MRNALAAAAVLATVGCRQEPRTAPAATVLEWAQPSPDGRLEIRERREGAGCRVEAVVKSSDGDRSLWTTQTCLPNSRAVFLSPNGERVLVLDLIPSSQASDWSHVPLISVWARGAVVRQYTGAEILGEEPASDMSRVLSWVAGDSYEDAHRAAHPTADGESVIVPLVDGRTLTLGFEGNPLPAPTPASPPARAAVQAADQRPLPEPALPAAPARQGEARGPDRTEFLAGDEQGLYSWEDDQGELHFGQGAQIPARFRKRARPVDATVGVVPVEKPEPAPPPPRSAGGPGSAQTGAAPPPGGGAQPPAGGGAGSPPPPPENPGT